MPILLEKIANFANTNKILLLLLLAVFVLRLPSLFEPLWYGDESIYLTVGQNLLDGKVLYLDIFDHKTPGIYYLTSLALKVFGSTLWSLRFLLLIWTLASVGVFFFLAKKLLDQKTAFFASFLFVLLTSTPILEGNAASSELLMILPICLGILLGLGNRFFLSGAFFSLAFLLKVPAVFDFGAFFLFILFSNFNKKEIAFRKAIFLALGFFTPTLISIFYFYFQGALADYFQAAFLFNISYTGYKNSFLFSNSLLLLKALPVIGIVGFFAYKVYFHLKKGQKVAFGFSSFLVLWLTFSFYGAAFGGRTYSHYLIQIVPAFCLLAGLLYKKSKTLFLLLFVFILSLALFLGFRPFVQPHYYPNTVRYVFGQLSFEDYAKGFDKRAPRNYALAGLLEKNAPKTSTVYLFSDQADIYFLSGLTPASKYLTFYHTNSQEKTKKETAEEIKSSKPSYILADENLSQFPELEIILRQDYNLFAFYENVAIYKISDLTKNSTF